MNPLNVVSVPLASATGPWLPESGLQSVSVDLHRRDLHSGNTGHSRFHHGEADRRRRDRPLLGLLPWVTSNDKPDFVKRKRVADLESDGEVAHVRGIERASKDTDLSTQPV